MPFARFLRPLGLIFGLVLVSPNVSFAAAQPPAPITPKISGNAPLRYFPETGHTVAGNFYDYYQSRGDLDLFGFPRTEAVLENGFTVQYFQRARMEWHPDVNKVQLTLLGSLATDGRTFDKVPASATTATVQYFPLTGHLTHDAFLAYYKSHGGLDQFGYPLSEEITEGGFRVQWFQRARFEWHPELPSAYSVSLTLLGDQYITKNLPTSGWLAPAPRPLLLAEGVSDFSYSPDVRVFNIALMAKKLNGTVVPDGATFSFYSVMGDVNASDGWAVGRVIVGNSTEDGLGGGICQVSTTAFRAAYWAGLPITERHDHAYPVPYYTQGGAPEGFDATVWPGSLDFKFVNDTGAPITITTGIDINEYVLFVDFYGKPTGRSVEMVGPVISNRKPHPPDRTVPDPKLAPGKVDQTDFAHDGFDVMIKRAVTTTAGLVTVDNFPSHYTPWAAVYHVGATPTPTADPSAPATPGGPPVAPSKSGG